MNVVFGKGDSFGHISFKNKSGFIGKAVGYTEPNEYPFFSKKYGYCVPIDGLSTPIEYILDDFPGSDLGTKASPIPTPRRFFRVTEEGNLFRIVVNEGSSFFVNQIPIFNRTCGWWIIEGSENISGDAKTIFGLLMTDPSKEKITEYCSTLVGGFDVEWYSIEEVVACIKAL